MLLNFVIFVLASLGAWKTALYVASFIEDQCLVEPQRRFLRETFESWWFNVQEMQPSEVAVLVARACSNSFNRFFGDRLLSRRAFFRSSQLATGILASALAGMAVSGTGFEPWKDFDKTIIAWSDVNKSLNLNDKVDESHEETVKIVERQKRYAIIFNTPSWRLAYCVFFFVALIMGNATAFALSAAVSRLILREIVLSGRIFSAISLLTLNLVLILVVVTAYLLFVGLLSFPAIWDIVIRLSSSFTILFWMLVGTGVFAWFLSEPRTYALAFAAASPFIVTAMICVVSMFALWSRDRFHEAVAWFLLRCADKKPISFVVGFFGLTMAFIAITSWILKAH